MTRPFALVLFFCCLPLGSYALNSDEMVRNWTSAALKRTLSVNYTEDRNELRVPSQYFTYRGWNNLASFLGSKVFEVRRYQLTLEPIPLSNPEIVEKGDYSGIAYWRVNQGWHLSPLDDKIWFSIIVLEQPANTLIIDSVSMHAEDTAVPSN